jgi:hypothetical protein
MYICEKPEFHTSDIEILWLEVIINNLKAMVGVIYRPPHSDVSYWWKLENNIQPILDLISSIRFGLFVINKWIHVADVWVICVGSHTTFSKFRRVRMSSRCPH